MRFADYLSLSLRSLRRSSPCHGRGRDPSRFSIPCHIKYQLQREELGRLGVDWLSTNGCNQQNCKPGTPCPLGNGNGGGGNGGNQMPSGAGVVQLAWNRPTASAFITNLGGFDSLMAQADDITNVAEVAAAISRFGVGTTTGLKALNDQKAQANIIGLVLGALGMIALLIASLGVMNTMIMSVLQRTREIGVTFGSIFVLVAKPVITKLAKSGSLTGATFTVPPWLMLAVIAGTSAIGFLSGFFPARRAASLDPVEALRYE